MNEPPIPENEKTPQQSVFPTINKKQDIESGTVKGADRSTSMMPAIKATDPFTIEDWHKENPCPRTGSGQELVHRWLLKAANASRRARLTSEQGVPFIALGASEEICGRVVTGTEINKAVQKAYNTPICCAGNYGTKAAVPAYDPDLLATLASRVDFEVTDYWLAEVSPECVLDISPAAFLSHVFECGEKVFITDKFKAKSGSFYLHDDAGLDCLDDFICGHQNVWFLSNPVDGLCHNDSIRSEANITSFRYGVLESDRAPADLWLRMLIQLHLPIVSICTSGGKSVHALFRVDASSKAEWDQIVRFGQTSVLSQLVPVGADPGALSAVRLTRLPGCIRGETGKEQKLLYLNPAADKRPIWRSKGNEYGSRPQQYFRT